jgi:hypothetical protein
VSDRKLTDRLQDCGGAWLDFGYEPDAAVCFEAKARIEELETELKKGNLARDLTIHCELKDQIKSLQAENTRLREERTCNWTKTAMSNWNDGEYDNWSTQCGEDFAIEEKWHEKPSKFCSNCGGKIVDITPEEDEA